jgi:HEAT repeat protein
MLDCVRLVGTNAGPLVPVLIINLNRTDWLAATLNADMLGELKLEPDVAVPALTKSLQDPRSEMRASAMRALGEFSELAKQALPALTNLLNDPDPDTRTNAATAIKRIAPKPSTAAATQ